MPPVAADGTILYEPTAAVFTAPVLAMVILPMVSLFCRPLLVKLAEPAPVVNV